MIKIIEFLVLPVFWQMLAYKAGTTAEEAIFYGWVLTMVCHPVHIFVSWLIQSRTLQQKENQRAEKAGEAPRKMRVYIESWKDVVLPVYNMFLPAAAQLTFYWFIQWAWSSNYPLNQLWKSIMMYLVLETCKYVKKQFF